MNRRALICWLPLLGLTAVSCGGDEIEPPEAEEFATYEEACAATLGCRDAPVDLAGPRERIWRVTVLRNETGELSFGTIDEVNVLTAVGIPAGPSAGDVLLVGEDASGARVDGQLIAFPQTRSSMTNDEIPSHVEEDLTGKAVGAVGYIRATDELTGFALVQVGGDVSVRAAVPAEQQAGEFGRSQQAQTRPSYCAHVRIVQTEADRDSLGWFVPAATTDIARLTYQERALIESAINLMPPALCRSISMIIPTKDLGTVNGFASHQAGNAIAVNTDRIVARAPLTELSFMRTILHEATHAANFLLDVEAAAPADFSGDWQPSWRQSARMSLENTRLERGLSNEWKRINAAFVAQGWAARLDVGSPSDEIKAEAAAEPEEGIVFGGFMSRYGSTKLSDDIAEMAAGAIMQTAYRARSLASPDDLACRLMQEYDDSGVPSRFAAVYTKLHFLADLGILSPEQVDDCTGPVTLVDGRPGFSFARAGTTDDNLYSTNLEAGIGSVGGGNYIFELQAEGTSRFGDTDYPATVSLKINLGNAGAPVEQVSWPRGVYALSTDSFLIALDGAPSFEMNEGFVLVAEASNERIAGSIFATGGIRYSAPPVPEVFDPPYVIRFVIDR